MTRRAAILTAASYQRVRGANERIGLGLIGAGTRGPHVMSQFQKYEEVQVRAVCDVYQKKIDDTLPKAPGARGFRDHRAVLEQKDIDAVLVATPDHWHAEITMDAMKAGKDVYVEKPLTFKREEGPKIVAVQKETRRICQVGLQQRSGPMYIKARDEFVATGKLGQITLARTWWPGGSGRPMAQRDMPQPADLDWKRYLGQVPYRPWNPSQYFNYRAFLEFGGGRITDLFTHWCDAVHMMMKQDSAVAIHTAGGKYLFKDDMKTVPDTIMITVEYDRDWLLTFESASTPGGPFYGIELCGMNGRVLVTRNSFEWRSNEKGAQPVVERVNRDITWDHVGNFLECCRTRKEPNCPPYEGHRSTQVALLAVQSLVERKRIRFDPKREVIL
jgi:predicted dehydrogenase